MQALLIPRSLALLMESNLKLPCNRVRSQYCPNNAYYPTCVTLRLLFCINQRLSVSIVRHRLVFALPAGGQVQDVTMATVTITT
jgi:hypothetical protein